MARKPAERVPYSAIVDRPPLKLPDGGRIAVWTVVNVEEWSIERPMPRTVLPPPYGQPLLPDLPNWAWHEYGMRVGFWRLVEVLAKYRIKATFAVNGSVCRSYPRVAKAALEAGWEFMGHGFVQRPMHQAEDQRAAIRDTIAAIREFTGKAPRGWESPVVSIPYTVETNDIPIMLLQHHSSDEWLRRGIDHFERLYAESEKITRVMAVSVHPYITGVPHRIGYLEKLYEHILSRPGVMMWTGEQVLDWYLSAGK